MIGIVISLSIGGAALVSAGVYLIAGPGVATITAGAFALAAAVILRRGL